MAQLVAGGPMVHARLTVNTTGASRTKVGLLWCAITLKWDGEGFPDLGWSDFAVVITCWWAEALHRLLVANESVEVRFMEGPYRAELSRLDATGIRVRCFESTRSRREVRHEIVARLDTLMDSVLKASDELLSVHRERDPRDSDVVALESAARSLRSARQAGV